MNTAILFTVAACTILAGLMAYELCYAVTVFGGHLPFMFLTIAGPLCYGLGVLNQE